MPRIARLVAIGLPHHITQRGNYSQSVFRDDKDRRQYLSWIQEYSDKYGVSMLVYCLMDDHVHFIAIPHCEDSLAKTFKSAHTRYSQYFNKKMRRVGHLWQGRFYSCVLDEPHLIMAARYVERNPVRASMVNKPWDWNWSSALAHVDGDGSLIKLDDLFKIIGMSSNSWKHYIDSREDEKTLNEIRTYTLTGRPLGDMMFVENMEKKFGRSFLFVPRGRPGKKQK